MLSGSAFPQVRRLFAKAGQPCRVPVICGARNLPRSCEFLKRLAVFNLPIFGSNLTSTTDKFTVDHGHDRDSDSDNFPFDLGRCLLRTRIALEAINPLHPTESLRESPKCGAHSRRTGQPCRAPAVHGNQRRRMHGGKGSRAPLWNQNAVTSGDYTAKARGQHLWLTLLHFWIDGDNRRRHSRITSPMEADALVGCLRAFKLTEVANDLCDEFNGR